MSSRFALHIEGECRISAHSVRTCGAPLSIDILDGGRAVSEITIFTDDQDYTDRLIAAINAVPRTVETLAIADVKSAERSPLLSGYDTAVP